jgi:hypothetical protein
LDGGALLVKAGEDFKAQEFLAFAGAELLTLKGLARPTGERLRTEPCPTTKVAVK